MPQTLTLSRVSLEHGATLTDVPIAYETWGRLNAARDNAILVCHPLTGRPDLTEWWNGLLGPGRALDPTRDFIICPNVPGSPYGSVSPLTSDPDTGEPYGADFPSVTIRDTVKMHRCLLDRLGVRQVACALGGSMGGMQVLEWAFEETESGAPFVRTLVPVAVDGRHSAWQIGWSEAQRQAIYADPNWQEGRYSPDAPPTRGLAVARMMAMVSYRSQPAFQDRFGREVMPAQNEQPFAVESYLRYQGDKLVERFDANCYVCLTEQMDTHDVARERGRYEDVLASISQPALVVGIDSDVLYPLPEQRQLAAHLPHATMETLSSPYGHDAFLIEEERLNDVVVEWRAEQDAVPSSLTA